jgi:membrane protease YdiL (CAAX protease family)
VIDPTGLSLTDSVPNNPPDPTPKWRWVDIALISGSALLVMVFGVLILRIARWSGLSQGGGVPLLDSIYIAGLESVALVGSVYLIGIRRRKMSWTEIGWVAPDPKWLILSAGAGLLLIPIAAGLAILARLAMRISPESPQLNFLAPRGLNLPGSIVLLLLVGVCAPVAEEIFFRGILYRWLRQSKPFPVSILISAAIFGVVHGEVSVALAAFFMGIVLALIFEKGKSLWLPVVVHIMINSIQLVLLYSLIAFGTIPLD